MLTTAPPPARTIAGTAWRQHSMVPSRSRRRVRFHSARSTLSTAVSPATDPPAQLNSVSILPKCSTARRTAWRTLSSSVTSAATPIACPPWPQIRPASCSMASGRRSSSASAAPSAAKRSAAALPMPPAAPVIRATRPASLPAAGAQSVRPAVFRPLRLPQAGTVPPTARRARAARPGAAPGRRGPGRRSAARRWAAPARRYAGARWPPAAPRR
ncbi:Uncharacterised protein [Bordetella pertussis]|nr:Uncharacterised protein [Bordetella pertussis]CPP01834.1 Uncharacterised protein [Bordetella pertussis]